MSHNHNHSHGHGHDHGHDHGDDKKSKKSKESKRCSHKEKTVAYKANKQTGKKRHVEAEGDDEDKELIK